MTLPRPGATLLTMAEVRHLTAVVKSRARAARAEVASRAAALLADFERAMQSELGPAEERLTALSAEAEQHLAKINTMLRDRCTEQSIPVAWAPVFSVSFPAREAALTTRRRSEMRKVATARLDAMKSQALLEIERAESKMLTELLSTQLITEPAAKWLDHLPTAELLLPPLSYAAVAELSAAELVPE